MWIEGRDVSSAVGDQRLSVGFTWCFNVSDNVKATVEPRPNGSSEATLRVLQAKRQGNDFEYFERYDDISNWVYPVLEIKVAPGEQFVAPQNGYLYMRLTETSDLYDWSGKHVGVPVPLNTHSGWQVKIAPCDEDAQWVPLGANERVTDSNAAGSDVKMYRYVGWQWNTTQAYSDTDADGDASSLLGHNGPHTLSLVEGSASFRKWDVGGGGWQTPYTYRTAEVNLKVSNVTISNVTSNVNEDYFIYDPTDATKPERQQPPFSFKINDGVNQGGYQVVLYMRETPNLAWPTNSYGYYAGPYMASVCTSPGTWTMTWNGYKENNNTNGTFVTEPCTYTFDIGVWETPEYNN